jgi:hypothetical protein
MGVIRMKRIQLLIDQIKQAASGWRYATSPSRAIGRTTCSIIVELKRFGGAPNSYPLHPYTGDVTQFCSKSVLRVKIM